MSTLPIQAFAALNDLTIIGTIAVRKDRFARTYANGVRVAFAHAAHTFTVLTCVDGSKHYVMTSDWQEVERAAGAA